MSALDVKTLAALQRDADGFRGLFVFVVDHTCSHCWRKAGIQDALVFIGDEDSGDRCEGWYEIGGMLEQHVGEPIARMLNATGSLLSMLKLGAP